MRMKEVGDETKAVAKTTGAVMRESEAEAIRGPTRSHTGPMARREKIEPTKAAMPAVPTSVAERLRVYRQREGKLSRGTRFHGEDNDMIMYGGNRRKRTSMVGHSMASSINSTKSSSV
ncbi:hypothetical protein SCA6_017739 [Theobroma cacao]